MMPEKLTKQRLRRISILSISLNFLLFVGKLIFAILMNSVAFISDAFNHFSDAFSGFVFWLGQTLSARKPDANHPLGHGRGEYLTSLTIAVLMLVVAGQFLIESIRRFFNPTEVILTPWALVILVVGMVMKITLYVYLRYLYQRTKLMSTHALAVDNLFDVFISGLVLLSLILQPFFMFSMDAVFGMMIALLMLYQGGRLLLTSVRRVLGESLDPLQKQAILEFLHRYPEVLGTHQFIFHDYGPTYQMVSFHLEVSETQTFLAMHDLVDEIEEAMQQEFGFQVMIHLDPMVTDPGELKQILTPIKAAIANIGLTNVVLALKPIKEKLHPEIVMVITEVAKQEALRATLQKSFPQYRFVYEVAPQTPRQ
jgi:cation diffusion facilitator family transporter